MADFPPLFWNKELRPLLIKYDIRVSYLSSFVYKFYFNPTIIIIKAKNGQISIAYFNRFTLSF